MVYSVIGFGLSLWFRAAAKDRVAVYVQPDPTSLALNLALEIYWFMVVKKYVRIVKGEE